MGTKQKNDPAIHEGTILRALPRVPFFARASLCASLWRARLCASLPAVLTHQLPAANGVFIMLPCLRQPLDDHPRPIHDARSAQPRMRRPNTTFISRRRDYFQRIGSKLPMADSIAGQPTPLTAATSGGANGKLHIEHSPLTTDTAQATQAAVAKAPAAPTAWPSILAPAASSAAPFRHQAPTDNCSSGGSSASEPGTNDDPSVIYADERSPPRMLLGPVDVGFAVLRLEEYEELKCTRLYVATRKVPIDDEGIAILLAAFDTVLARGAPLTICYDLRTSSIPSRKHISVGLDWISANSHLLDRDLQGIAIIFSSMFVRGVVNLVLSITQPPQPNICCADELTAFAFARDKCTEIRERVGKSKLKRQRSGGAMGSPGGGSTPSSPRQGRGASGSELPSPRTRQ